MKARTNRMLLLLTTVALAACGGGDGEGKPDASEAESYLNANVVLPPGSYTLDAPETDESIVVEQISGGGTAAMGPGAVGTVTLPFQAPEGTRIVGGGMRFGESGPVNVVPIDTGGQTTGTISFQFGIPDSVCENLSNVCHDIKCYEFAVTDAGTISRANINSIGVLCGGCDEPSCRDLMTSCGGDELICNDVSDCSSGGNFAICVSQVGATQPRCGYRVGGQVIECETCTDAAVVQACADRAMRLCDGD